MRLTFRAKLLAIVGTAAAAFVVLIVVDSAVSQEVGRQLADIQRRYVPLLEHEPRLSGQLDRPSRSFQNAVGAHDRDALGDSAKIRNGMVAALAASSTAIEPGAARALQAALDDYVHAATDVSQRLIVGKAGEALVGAIAAMQGKQAHVAELLKSTTAFDRRTLADAFEAVSGSEASAARIQLVVSVVCLVLVLTLSLAIGRGVLRSVASLTQGFARFGQGEFAKPIAVASSDDLRDLGERANAMAASLQHLAKERERTDWLTGGLAGPRTSARGRSPFCVAISMRPPARSTSGRPAGTCFAARAPSRRAARLRPRSASAKVWWAMRRYRTA